jgi:class 3 adenylate cyclase
MTADSSVERETLPPTGTVTLLFSDIEGSTRLWETQPPAMGAALTRHDALLRSAIRSHRGHVFKTMGARSAEQLLSAFPRPALCDVRSAR